jgi:hypothetical protein
LRGRSRSLKAVPFSSSEERFGGSPRPTTNRIGPRTVLRTATDTTPARTCRVGEVGPWPENVIRIAVGNAGPPGWVLPFCGEPEPPEPGLEPPAGVFWPGVDVSGGVKPSPEAGAGAGAAAGDPPVDCETKAATSAICCALKEPENDGMMPLPEVTRVTTVS